MSTKIWNDESDNFRLARHTALPRGDVDGHVRCPKCRSSNITGAIICNAHGSQVIESADDADPNKLCIDCGYWADAF